MALSTTTRLFALRSGLNYVAYIESYPSCIVPTAKLVLRIFYRKASRGNASEVDLTGEKCSIVDDLGDLTPRCVIKLLLTFVSKAEVGAAEDRRDFESLSLFVRTWRQVNRFQTNLWGN